MKTKHFKKKRLESFVWDSSWKTVADCITGSVERSVRISVMSSLWNSVRWSVSNSIARKCLKKINENKRS